MLQIQKNGEESIDNFKKSLEARLSEALEDNVNVLIEKHQLSIITEDRGAFLKLITFVATNQILFEQEIKPNYRVYIDNNCLEAFLSQCKFEKDNISQFIQQAMINGIVAQQVEDEQQYHVANLSM